jgi:DNA polymerase III delta prime subunit
MQTIAEPTTNFDESLPDDHPVAGDERPAHLPPLRTHEGELAPLAPTDPRDVGISLATLRDLALKTAYTVSQFNTEWAARQLCLPQVLVGELLEQIRADQLLDVLGSSGPFGLRFAISSRGRERAARLLQVSGYVGPAPVSLEAYTAMIEWQLARAPEVTRELVVNSLAELVLPEGDVLLAGLAASSGRSLFIYGPPGNGKTSLGHLIHRALLGDIWVPHCIAIEENIIRVYDPQLHQAVEVANPPQWSIDRRWVKIRRPLVIGGGEMTLESFDLTYSPSLRYYEAPLHLKANGGMFLIDDFGRQRVAPHELLNRWIVPLENRIDYLTLQTGQKIQIPFRQTLVIATNLDPERVTDPAFMRRMGYRLCLAAPSPDRYREIFERYASRLSIPISPGVVERLLERYASDGRELRGCEPRDLIERARDICRYTGRRLELDDDLLTLAWTGYFGTKPTI